jgi:hypothetical protein
MHIAHNVADPDQSGIRCYFDPWIRIRLSGMGKTSGYGSGMNIPDRISECLETMFFGLKIFKFFDSDPGSNIPWIRDGKNRIRDQE